MELIKSHPEGLNGQPWNIVGINLFWEFVETHPESLNGQHWDIYDLSRNVNLSGNFVESNPKGPNVDVF